MKIHTLRTSSLLAVTAAIAISVIGITPATAAEPEGLAIDPIGYPVIDGAINRSDPITIDGLTDDPGYSATESFVGSAPTRETVLGQDGRIQVQRTTDAPYRWIGQLTIDRNRICTAWLISASTAVTAGHCVDSDFTSLTFSPGRNGANDPYGSIGIDEVWVDARGTDADGGDWAVLQLDSPIGDTVGWYGISPISRDAITEQSASVIGYPGDKPRGTLWEHNDVIIAGASTDRIVRYLTDTAGGQSGSAVTIENPNVAQGIHIWGGSIFSGNGATRITGELFNTLAQLRE